MTSRVEKAKRRNQKPPPPGGGSYIISNQESPQNVYSLETSENRNNVERKQNKKTFK